MESSIAERHGTEVTGCPVMGHDFSKTREMGAYWALANELRESCPHFYNKYADGGYWVFTRHEAVNDIYKTPEIFSSASITPWEPDPIYRFVPTQVDAPDHIKYRRILNPWFSPKAMEAAGPMIRETCRGFIEPIVPKGECDFFDEFALRFPTAAFLSVIGVPASYTDVFVGWVDAFFGGFGGDPEGAAGMATALAEMRVFWSEQLDNRRSEGHREGDLFSYLLESTFDDQPLDDEVLLDMCTVLDARRARHHARRARVYVPPPGAAPGAPAEAGRRPGDHPARGRGDPSLLHDHLRRRAQGHPRRRVPWRAAEAGRHGVRARIRREPRSRHWEQADEFVIDRKKNNHFGFASGPHRCLGMHLARREMAIAVDEWLKVIPDFELATDAQLFERGGGAMMSLSTLPLRWEVNS